MRWSRPWHAAGERLAADHPVSCRLLEERREGWARAERGRAVLTRLLSWGRRAGPHTATAEPLQHLSLLTQEQLLLMPELAAARSDSRIGGRISGGSLAGGDSACLAHEASILGSPLHNSKYPSMSSGTCKYESCQAKTRNGKSS